MTSKDELRGNRPTPVEIIPIATNRARCEAGLSSSALKACEWYEGKFHQSHEAQPDPRVLGVLFQDVTIGKWLSQAPLLTDIAALAPTARVMNDEILGKNARAGVGLYIDRINDPAERRYAATLIAEIAELNTELAAYNNPSQIHSTNMVSIVNRYNIESLIVGAVANYYDLARCGKSTYKYADAARRSEQFFAPFCEIVGYDVLAMAQRSEALLHELSQNDKGKTNKAKNRAQGILDRYRDPHEVEAIFNAFARDLGFGVRASDIVVKNNSGLVDSIMGEAYLNNPFGHTSRAVWRVKSYGSLANKLLFRRYSREPDDILGLTIIDDDAAAAFHQFIDNVSRSNKLEFLNMGEEARPIRVYGSKDYRENIGANIPLGLIDRTKFEPRDNDFDAMKVYVQYGEHKIEVQFHTPFTRANCRFGGANHVGYKSGEVISREDLYRIWRRGQQSFDGPTLREGTEKRADALMARIQKDGRYH